MRSIILAILVFVTSLLLFAGDPPETPKSTPAFDKIKALAGSWNGKDDEGKPVSVSYKVVSSGSSVMETLAMQDHPDNMITMYNLDGEKVMMTHYCSMGNQPRMKASGLSKDGKTLSFKFVDATNMKSAKDAHMHSLVVTFKDENHITQAWTMFMNGKEEHQATFDYERAK